MIDGSRISSFCQRRCDYYTKRLPGQHGLSSPDRRHESDACGSIGVRPPWKAGADIETIRGTGDSPLNLAGRGTGKTLVS
jgi:hypothetical protein